MLKLTFGSLALATTTAAIWFEMPWMYPLLSLFRMGPMLEGPYGHSNSTLCHALTQLNRNESLFRNVLRLILFPCYLAYRFQYWFPVFVNNERITLQLPGYIINSMLRYSAWPFLQKCPLSFCNFLAVLLRVYV